MALEIGTIDALHRFPVKSMRGEALESAALGWHGIEGDRRFALRRVNERIDFPWLSASRLPALIDFTPLRRGGGDGPPTHVRTPEGAELEIFSDEFAADIARRLGAPVEMMQLRNGIFDDGAVSVIAAGTAGEICRLGGCPVDIRRFRPNILLRTAAAIPFEEDGWVGGTLTFGKGAGAPAVAVTARDVRCAMLNLDPDGGPSAPGMMKAAVQANGNNAGVYGTVIRAGRLEVGAKVYLQR